MIARLAAAALAATALAACATAPSPLAPGFHGSVGAPSYGVLRDGVPLADRGPGFRRLRPASPNRYGTSGLVAALTDAAARVSRHPGDPPLLVGDLAGPRGGKLPGHNSHRTGRDVDLLFFTTTPGGAPLRTPGFFRFGPDALAETADGEFLRFDVARNWQLVRALLTTRAARAQWIFVVTHLEALLIEHARALGEPPELIWQAENVLHQPGDSAPHDDHFHLRVACNEADEIAGCLTGAPAWPWWPSPATLAASEPSPLWTDLDETP